MPHYKIREPNSPFRIIGALYVPGHNTSGGYFLNVPTIDGRQARIKIIKFVTHDVPASILEDKAALDVFLFKYTELCINSDGRTLEFWKKVQGFQPLMQEMQNAAR